MIQNLVKIHPSCFKCHDSKYIHFCCNNVLLHNSFIAGPSAFILENQGMFSNQALSMSIGMNGGG